jgi:hypothetical protein
MALSQQQIQQFTMKAKQAGFSDDEIVAEIARKSAEVQQAPQSTPQPTVAPPPQQVPQKSFAENVGGGVINLGKELSKPFTRTLSNIGTAGIAVPQSAIAAMVSKVNPEKGAQIASKDILGTQSLAQEVAKDPKKAMTQQLKDSVNVASYAVPFGKARTGANIVERGLTKAVLPGAGVGAMQGLSEDDVTAEGVIGNAVLGGVAAGVLGGAGKVAKKVLGKGGSKVANAGTNARTGKVTLKSSMSGARREKEVVEVLKKYGIKGTPQKRYEMLEPTVEKISGQVDSALSKNPKQVTLTEVEEVFNKKIAEAVKQGDLTLPEAQQAFREYFGNVAQVDPALFQNGVSDTQRLFSLKKDVQAATSQVAAAMKKAENKATLTPTQKSMKAIRDSLDEVITIANPEVKELTVDQSKLYEAAVSLGIQRKTVPTQRILGITVPKSPVSNAIDKVGAGAELVGKASSTAGKYLPDIAESNLGGQIATRVPLVLSNGIPQPTQNAEGIESSVNNYNGSNNIKSQANQNLSPPIGGELPPLEANYITGYSPEQLYQGYMDALGAGDTDAAKQLMSWYEDETAYQKTQGGAGKPLSGPNSVLFNKAQTAISSLDRIEQLLETNPGALWGKKFNPLNQTGRVMGADIASAIDILGFFRTGAAITPDQRKDYEYMFPSPLDDEATRQAKLDNLRDEFEGYVDGLNQSRGVTDTLPTTPQALY